MKLRSPRQSSENFIQRRSISLYPDEFYFFYLVKHSIHADRNLFADKFVSTLPLFLSIVYTKEKHSAILL